MIVRGVKRPNYTVCDCGKQFPTTRNALYRCHGFGTTCGVANERTGVVSSLANVGTPRLKNTRLN